MSASGESSRGEEVQLRWKPAVDVEERLAYFDLIYQPLFGVTGAADGILHLASDVTEKVQRRLLIERYAAERETILEHLECRLAGKPPFYDRKYPGSYNARRDNLEGFWKGLFRLTHGIMVVNAFYENVNRHRMESRELAPGEEVENVVLEFNSGRGGGNRVAPPGRPSGLGR